MSEESPHEFANSFKSATQFRNYQIVVDDRVFYVNAYWLAEHSSYFAKLFFEDFKEAKEKKLVLGPESGISADDFMEYLCLSYGTKELTVENCAVHIRMADMWDNAGHQKKCRKLLESDYWKNVLELPSDEEIETAIDILAAAVRHGLKESVMRVVAYIGRFASMKLLKQTNFMKRIDDCGTVGSVMFLVGRNISMHTWAPVPEYSGRIRKVKTCVFTRCNRKVAYMCTDDSLNLYACTEHKPLFACFGKRDPDGRQLTHYETDGEFARYLLHGEYQIFVRTLAFRTITLHVFASDTIARVMLRIERKEGTPCERFGLIYGGKQLKNERTLSDYNIEKEATLHMNYRPILTSNAKE